MKFPFLLFVLAVMLSCSQKKERQTGIIPRQQMETLLWQMLQADELITLESYGDSSKKNNTAARFQLYQKVLDLNKTSQEAFKNSYQYYLIHPEVGKPMFDSIAARANRGRSEPFKPPIKVAN